MNTKKLRLLYALCFFALLALEVLIALFVHDDWIRPYGGDLLVTVLLCCFLRILFPKKGKLLPLWVFLFSVCAECSQMIPLVDLIGLGGITFFRVLMGTAFSLLDIVCYGAGCLLFFGAEHFARRRKKGV